jgi:predicted RNA-binding Zn-ribbon protein involved in translation (DUF1610 family)
VPTKKHKFRIRFLFQEFDLSTDEFTIGRSPSCNLTLEDPLVSRKHALIRVEETKAFLDDLGSRNGTLVNGGPIFENQVLNHTDRIRIGTHDLVFVQEKIHPIEKVKSTAHLLICPSCGVPFPESNPRCPHCGLIVIPDKVCLRCRTQAKEDALFCSKCGQPLNRDESTIPVELGGGSSGWTTQLIEEVIEKALSVGRFEQAARLLDGKINEFEKDSTGSSDDILLLAKICRLNAVVALGLQDGTRFDWIVEQWTKYKTLIPEELVQAMIKNSADWYEIIPKLDLYLSTFEPTNNLSDEDTGLFERLCQLTGKTRH